MIDFLLSFVWLFTSESYSKLELALRWGHLGF